MPVDQALINHIGAKASLYKRYKEEARAMVRSVKRQVFVGDIGQRILFNNVGLLT